ncbi:MAG: hypothetical protein AAFQ43_13845 [Bacteroidota bacterium]
MRRQGLRAGLIAALVLGASALLGRTEPSTYDEAWAALPLHEASADSLRAADGREVTLTGYVVPLGVGQPERFLLSPFAPGCPFCEPGLASAVEVVADAAPPARGPVAVRGTLAVRPDPSNPGGEPQLALLHATARPAP